MQTDKETSLLKLLCRTLNENELNTIFNENGINNIIASYENNNNIINEEEKSILKLFYISKLLRSTIHKKDTNEIIEDMLIQMTNTPYPLKYNNISTRKSEIHGNGVFATSDIEKNTIVTFYPAHCIICDDEKDYIGRKKHIFQNEKIFEVDNNYMTNVNEKYSIIGDPQNVNNSLLLGHMINDSQSLKIDTEINNETIENIKNKISEYLLKSNNNCITIHNKESGVCYIKTTKNIKKDDELLMSYQFPYWFDKKQLMQLKNLTKNDVSFNLFIIKNTEELMNKNEFINLMKNIQKEELLKNKKDLTLFIKYVNQNKTSFENNINIIIRELIKELNCKETMIDNYENIKNNINNVSKLFDFKENSEIYNLWNKLIMTK